MSDIVNGRNWIAGQWEDSADARVAVVNPSDTAETVGWRLESPPETAVRATAAARSALKAWARTPIAERGEQLYRLAEALEHNLDRVAMIASREMGKPLAEMRGEVRRGVQILQYYAAEGVRALGQVIPSQQASVLQYTQRVPLGVVGVITPWNFPVAIPLWKMAPAWICGNTVVWKPAEWGSLTATVLTEVLVQAGLPAGVLNLVLGAGSQVGDALVRQGDIDALSFTGSVGVGRQLQVVAAQRQVKCQAEMGGKNAAVVLADADLKLAAAAIVSGAFRSAGQKCTATSRIIVESSIQADLVAALHEAMQAVSVGPASDPATYCGPVASEAQYAKVHRYYQLATADAEVLVRQAAPAATGYFIEPLIVTGVAVDHPLVQDEIFGPIATVVPARDFDEAVSLTNRTVYGLSASVFTQNLRQGLRFLEEAEAGMVRVNQETAGVEYQAPFGGMKASSSHSREQGQAALEFYSQTKTCAIYYG
jgi:acyl-CoA reductase-like NAD-dependent aldehyde dehydrogenase